MNKRSEPTIAGGGNNEQPISRNDKIIAIIEKYLADYPEMKTMVNWNVNASHEQKEAAIKAVEQICEL